MATETTGRANWTNVSNQTLVISTAPVILYGIYPRATTAAAVTVNDGASNVDVVAIGLPQAGRRYADGIVLQGLTVTAGASDTVLVAWRPASGL